MNILFSPVPIQLHKAIAAIRIIVGLMLVYHGLEVFDPEAINGYLDWEIFKGPNGKTLVYIGKASEFLSGSLLTLGLFTRLGAILLIGALSYITFFIGQGRFWYEEQHPFMFVLFGVLFFFTGPCAWSLDGKLFGKDSRH
jgi:putative oxidoreductase